MQLRYVVAKVVPDLVRDEPINVGIILQSDQFVSGRFIERIPRDWGLPLDVEKDVVINLHAAWKARLKGPPETAYSPTLHEHRSLEHTNREFLEWIRETHSRHLRFSEVREAEIEVSDAFHFDTFLHRLYEIFVVPKPRPRKPVPRSTLHTAVKQELFSLDKPIASQIRDRDVIVGTFPWQVDFVYKTAPNGGPVHEVGIALVDFAAPYYVAKAKDLTATWVDVAATRANAVQRITVVGGLAAIPDHGKAFGMLQRFSDAVYVFDRQRDDLVGRVASDLSALRANGWSP